MAKIFVSRKFPGTHLDRLLNSGHEVHLCEFDRPLEAEEFLERTKGMDAVLSFLTDKIDGEVIDAIGPQVKIFSNYAVGFDNINVKEATDRKVLVSNTPCDEVNEAVAEHAVTLMLGLARRIVEADESTKRGSYRGWEPSIFLGRSIKGKTLGIVGLGRIGTMVAQKVKGFDMKVLYNKRSPDPEAEKEFGQKDDHRIVFDEFVSIFITFIGFSLGISWYWLIVGFLLNRFFDIVKPQPIFALQRLPAGWGIMMDDVIAGVYSNVVLRVIMFFFNV